MIKRFTARFSNTDEISLFFYCRLTEIVPEARWANGAVKGILFTGECSTWTVLKLADQIRSLEGTPISIATF